MNDSQKTITRRNFLRYALGTGVAVTMPVSYAGILPSSVPVVKDLRLHNLHTEEKISLSYFEQGQYISDALRDISYLLRDHRTGDVLAMDPGLIDLLYDLKGVLGTEQPLQVISGYRSPKTNAALHKNSSGVASKSLHMQGKAIDICIEGVDTRDIQKAAISLARGGVGYYPRSNFVHIDTGRVRAW
ncbi:MAG: Twin-arginine translocation pathway signal [Gammaproteobacteria bacterium]|nr:MAG: Twin-arginine translocation pathway signal [Gammaproteobacteria bacterium]